MSPPVVVSGAEDVAALHAQFDSEFGASLPDGSVARLTRALVKCHGWKRVGSRTHRRNSHLGRGRERRPSCRRQTRHVARSTSSTDPGDSDQDAESDPPWLPGHGEFEEQATSYQPPLLVVLRDRLNPKLRCF